MKIIIPELDNPTIKEATSSFSDIEFIKASDPDTAAKILSHGEADSIISGLDFSSREVLVAFKKHLPLKSQFFSSCFICQKADQVFALADGGVNKNPTKDSSKRKE